MELYLHHLLRELRSLAKVQQPQNRRSRFWGCSSVGRALESHSRGQGFDSPQLHGTRVVRPRDAASAERVALLLPGIDGQRVGQQHLVFGLAVFIYDAQSLYAPHGRAGVAPHTN